MKKAGHDMSSSQLSFPVIKVLKEGNKPGKLIFDPIKQQILFLKSAVSYFNIPRQPLPDIHPKSEYVKLH